MKKSSGKFEKGVLVEWDGQTCTVLKRRRVTAMAMFQVSEFEVYLETLNGEQVGWVPENEVVNVSNETDDA